MYKIILHRQVTKEDFRPINLTDKQKIIRIIEKKLSLNPEIFGKPLKAELKGCYRLRIDPYRIVYMINKKEVIVFIVKICLRKDLIAYLEAAKRLKLISEK